MTDYEHHPKKIIDHLMEKDNFSRWLGIKVIEISFGACTCSMVVRKDMINGFGILHGGIAFALADSTLAFASNSHGNLSVALKATISYTRKIEIGEVLTATACEEYLGRKTALYRIDVTNKNGEKVAVFDGTVYRTGKSII